MNSSGGGKDADLADLEDRPVLCAMTRRPNQVPTRPLPSPAEIERARYVGSGEHKAVRWWGGLPLARVGKQGVAERTRKQKTTICPMISVAERDTATSWVKAAIQAGQYRFREGDKDFPKHIWYRDAYGQVWFGYCLNSVLGEYKGWPIDEDEHSASFG